MRRIFTTLAMLVAVSDTAILAQDRPVRTIEDGIVDLAKLYVDTLPKSDFVVVRLFSATDADITEGEKKEETKKMQADGPKILADIELDPGSRAKRYLVGFGSGKSAVKVTGTIVSADGMKLAEFEQRRVGTAGIAAGDSLGKLTSDARRIGEDFAKLLSEWAKGKKLN